jgi:hypothetical protein
MKHRTKQLVTLGLSLAIAFIATALIAQLASAGAPSAPTERPALLGPGATISGTVVKPDGSLPVPVGTKVRLVDPTWLADPRDALIRGEGFVSLINGEFSIGGVPPGNYLMRAQAPDASPFTPSPWFPLTVLTTNIYITPPIRLTNPVITGTVFGSNLITPTPAVGAKVHIYSGTLRLDTHNTQGTNGDFKFGGLLTGTYRLEADAPPDSFDASAPPRLVTLPPVPQFITLTLVPPLIAGIVREPGPSNAPPVPDAKVIAVFAVSPTQIRVDMTGPSGTFGVANVPVIPNVTTATLYVEPPLGREGLLPPPPQVVTVPRGPLNINFLAPNKGIGGFVKTNTNVPVHNALVEANRLDRPGHIMMTTLITGFYGFKLVPGLWAVTVRQISTTNPAGWVYPFPAQIVYFEDNTIPEGKQVDFTVLTPDSTVKGNVQLPGGAAPSTEGITVTVGLFNDEGLGLTQLVDAGGNYTFQVPHGPYKLGARPESLLYAAPPPTFVLALSGSVSMAPTVTLIRRDALITGTVTDGSSMPVEGIPVIAWNESGGTFAGTASSDGTYAIGVFSGTWRVRPAPRPEQSYVYSGTATEVSVASGGTAQDVDFSLITADATIHGILVDGSGMPALARGWAGALQLPPTSPPLVNGAPIVDGQFDIKVPAGTYAVKLNLPSNQGYMASRIPQTITVGAGTIVTETFVLIKPQAQFRGGAFDRRTNISVNVDGRVGARDGDLWAGTDLKPGGLYTLSVAAGVWTLNYEIFNTDYIKAVGPRSYAMTVTQIQLVGLPLLFKDAILAGRVMITRNNVLTPAIGAGVIVEGISPDVMGVVLRMPVAPDGRFFMRLPHGIYNVRSVLFHDTGLINPVLKQVVVPPSGVVNVDLVYRQPDARIIGTVSGSYPPTLPVVIHGWTVDDGYNTTIARGGMYTLHVTSGITWNVIAKTETRSAYWITRTRVPPIGVLGTVTANLNLIGPKLKPAPVTIVFDPTTDQAIELADGTRLYIPAGAMPVSSGRVILHITPLANAIHHRNGDVLGLNYAFEAYTEDGQRLTSNFNSDVSIIFKYDPAELAASGVDPDRVKPAYFSTTTNSWTVPDSYVVNETTSEITMQIDHFTDFALLSVESSTSNNVFLPLIVR